MQAIAILHVDPELAAAALEGATFTALEDCVLVPLGVPLTSEPAELAIALAEVAGPLVQVHHEPRGVPVFPTTYALAAKRWAAAIEELGEAADWIDPSAAAPMAGLDMGALMGAMGGADMAAFAQHLQGPEGAALLEQAMQMAQQLAQNGGFAQLAQQMGQSGVDPEMLARQMQGGGADSPDLTALAEQAQAMLQGADLSSMAEQAKAMLAANPELEAQLRGMIEDEDDEDA